MIVVVFLVIVEALMMLELKHQLYYCIFYSKPNKKEQPFLLWLHTRHAG